MVILKERVDKDLRVRDLRDELVKAFDNFQLGKAELTDKNIDRLNSEKRYVICKNMNIIKDKYKELEFQKAKEVHDLLNRYNPNKANFERRGL